MLIEIHRFQVRTNLPVTVGLGTFVLDQQGYLVIDGRVALSALTKGVSRPPRRRAILVTRFLLLIFGLGTSETITRSTRPTEDSCKTSSLPT